MAAALLSALTGEPVPQDTVIFGEIGLSGEIRAVGQSEQRLKEAAKLGFERAWTPPRRGGKAKAPPGPDGLGLEELGHLEELVARFAEGGEPAKAAR